MVDMEVVHFVVLGASHEHKEGGGLPRHALGSSRVDWPRLLLSAIVTVVCITSKEQRPRNYTYNLLRPKRGLA